MQPLIIDNEGLRIGDTDYNKNDLVGVSVIQLENIKLKSKRNLWNPVIMLSPLLVTYLIFRYFVHLNTSLEMFLGAGVLVVFFVINMAFLLPMLRDPSQHLLAVKTHTRTDYYIFNRGAVANMLRIRDRIQDLMEQDIKTEGEFHSGSIDRLVNMEDIEKDFTVLGEVG